MYSFTTLFSPCSDFDSEQNKGRCKGRRNRTGTGNRNGRNRCMVFILHPVLLFPCLFEKPRTSLETIKDLPDLAKPQIPVKLAENTQQTKKSTARKTTRNQKTPRKRRTGQEPTIEPEPSEPFFRNRNRNHIFLLKRC